MSGVAGGNRVDRYDVKNIVDSYVNNILLQFPLYRDHLITGSFNLNTKKDFGDIDLIVTMEGKDKRQIKKDFVEFLNKISDDQILRFTSDKYRGKRTHNAGELVSILYPQGKDNLTVQIDNIIATNEQEAEFKNNFLSLPAEIQALYIGLTKISLMEDPSKIGILSITSKSPILRNTDVDFSYSDVCDIIEFNLSSSCLSLRKVTINRNFKELKRSVLWESQDWKDVETLVENYNVSLNFEKSLFNIKNKLSSNRSHIRIKGIFNSIVSIKSGEINTPKGERKRECIEMINKEL